MLKLSTLLTCIFFIASVGYSQAAPLDLKWTPEIGPNVKV